MLTTLCTSATLAFAQGNPNTGSVKGTVADEATLHPLSDAQVSIEGSQRGAVTTQNGEFTITGITPGTITVRVRRIGYTSATQNVTVTAGGTATVTFRLHTSALSLDQVVVTGTPTATSQRKIGNAVTTLNVADITQRSSVTNVTDVLQGKTPGVVIVPGSGAPGTAADIRIRGTSSLATNNRPIFYIDGVRYSDAPAGNYNPSGDGFAGGAFSQGASALDVVNPEDIESIQVLKGPAASTLYGADAAGGVIQIITKKGRRGQKPSWTVKGEVGSQDWALATPVNYTTCTAARIAQINSDGNTAWPGCQDVPVGTVLTGDPLHDNPQALRSGAYQNLVGSVRGGADRYSYYLSADHSKNEGVFYNSYDNRTSGRANFGVTMSDKLDFNINSTYVSSQLRLPLSDDAASGIIISATRGKPGQRPNASGADGFAILGPAVSNEYNNQTHSERTIFGGTANYRPFSWFNNRLTAGMDYNNARATVYYPVGGAFSQSTYPGGLLSQADPLRHLYTFDYAGTVTRDITSSLNSATSVGVQGNRNVYRRTEATGSGFPSADFSLVGAATTVTGSTSFSQQSSLGYFVQEQLGWANRLFVTGAVRADDNSAFGTQFNKVYYPKASLSYIASEEPVLTPILHAIHADNLKLRFAYGQAGRAPGPYDAFRTYGATTVILGNSAASGLIPGSTGNPDLHAERGVETEIGFDASFFSNRIGIEFTRYDKRTNDALISIANAPSLGFTASKYINFGSIKNSGTELGVTLRPLDLPWLSWESQINYSTNHNLLTRFAYQGLSVINVYDPYIPVEGQRILEGYPIAGWWSVDAERNADGTYHTDANGKLVLTPLRYVGPSTPTHEGSFSNTFTIAKNFRLYGLIDFKGGYYLLNWRDRNRNQGSNRNSKNQNNGSLSPLDSVYLNTTAITAPWIQQGDFVKLRDVSLSYTLPTAFANAIKFSGATFTVAGHNLGFLSKKYPGLDPEVNFVGQGTFSSSERQFLRVDSYTMPMLRRWTTSLTLNF